jgi:glutaredoxin
MIAKSGQRGVPVIAIDDEIIVGFDRERLESILAGGQPA